MALGVFLNPNLTLEEATDFYERSVAAGKKHEAAYDKMLEDIDKEEANDDAREEEVWGEIYKTMTPWEVTRLKFEHRRSRQKMREQHRSAIHQMRAITMMMFIF